MTWKLSDSAKPAWRTIVGGALLTAAVAVAIAALMHRAHAPLTPLTLEECLSTLGETDLARTAAPRRRRPPEPTQPDIGLGSGPIGLTYYLMADGLVKHAKERGISLFNIETAGSEENLDLLVKPFNMALAFAQSDVLDAAKKDEKNRLRVVMPLYLEELHVVARIETGSGRPLKRLRDLEGMRVLVSDRSTGSQYTAKRLMALGGIRPDGGHVKPEHPAVALCGVLIGKADAMITVAGQPAAQLDKLKLFAHHPARPLEKVQFLSLFKDDLRESEESTPEGVPIQLSPAFYQPTELRRDSYSWAFIDARSEGKGIPTLAVRAVLIAYNFPRESKNSQFQSKCEAVNRISRLLHDPDVTGRLCQLPYHRKWCELAPKIVVPGWEDKVWDADAPCK